MIKFDGFQKSRPDNHVHISRPKMLNQPTNLPRPMLPIPIHLHRQIVIVQCRVSITRLHRPADPQVKRERNHLRPDGNLPHCVIGRSIVDHQHIAKARQSPAQTMHQLADRIPFIKDRNNDQATHRTIRWQCESLHKQPGKTMENPINPYCNRKSDFVGTLKTATITHNGP